jgi:hypothetical protein
MLVLTAEPADFAADQDLGAARDIITDAAPSMQQLQQCALVDATPLKDAVEDDEGGLAGVIIPWVLFRGGGVIIPGSISALRVTGDPAKGDPGGATPPHPPHPLIAL